MIKVGDKILIGYPVHTLERVNDVLFIIRDQHDEIIFEGGYFKLTAFLRTFDRK